MRAYLLLGASCLSVALWTYGCSEDESTLATASSSASGPTTSTTGPGSGGSIASVGAGAQGGSAQGGSAQGGSAQGGAGGQGGSTGGMGGMMSGAGGMMSGAGGSGAVGGGGGMMSGVGGGSMCLTCSQYLQACLNMNGCPSESLLCQQSLMYYQPLETCTCATCSGQCTQTCSNMGTDSMGCFGCLVQAAQSNCQAELQACGQD